MPFHLPTLAGTDRRESYYERGRKRGSTETYYSVCVYRFDDDDPYGEVIESSSMRELTALVQIDRERTLARSRPNEWPDAQAYEISRPIRHVVTFK